MRIAGLLMLVWLLAGCGFPAWRDQALRDVTEGRWHVNPEQVSPGSASSQQTIEFRDASGRNVGYGKVQGGTVEFFNSDSSRAGYGKIGPEGSVELFNPNSSRQGFGKGR